MANSQHCFAAPSAQGLTRVQLCGPLLIITSTVWRGCRQRVHHQGRGAVLQGRAAMPDCCVWLTPVNRHFRLSTFVHRCNFVFICDVPEARNWTICFCLLFYVHRNVWHFIGTQWEIIDWINELEHSWVKKNQVLPLFKSTVKSIFASRNCDRPSSYIPTPVQGPNLGQYSLINLLR